MVQQGVNRKGLVLQYEFYSKQMSKVLKSAVKAFCVKNEIDECEVAQAVGVPFSSLSCYLNGHRGVPIGVLVAVCKEIQDARPYEKFLDLTFGQLEGHGCINDAFNSARSTLQESAECVGEMFEALRDGVVTQEECEDCCESIDAAIEELRRDKVLLRRLVGEMPKSKEVNSLAEAERLEKMARKTG